MVETRRSEDIVLHALDLVATGCGVFDFLFFFLGFLVFGILVFGGCLIPMVFKLTVLCFLMYHFPSDCHGHREAKETHFPGYHFCGPGTNYLERVARGQVGINKLDEACRQHDLVYTDSADLKLRMEADVRLELQAWARVTATDSGYKEKIAAWMVTNVMKVKRKWNNRSLRRESGDKKKKRNNNLAFLFPMPFVP